MAASLREASLPRFAMRRDEAAASLGVSLPKFLQWVKDGRMPAGRKIDGVALWDVESVRSAWLRLRDAEDSESEDDGSNPFNGCVA